MCCWCPTWCACSWPRNCSGGGYDRTIWVDADVIIFDPDRFAIGVSPRDTPSAGRSGSAGTTAAS